jgi:hypothetical protein
MRLLEIEHPNHPHALRWILQTLRNECRAVRIRLAREANAQQRVNKAGGPVDPVLGAVVDETAEAVDQLPPAEKQVLLLVAEGLHPADIAVLLDRSSKTIRMRLYRARKHVRELRKRAGGAASAFVLLLPRRLRNAGGRALRFGSGSGTAPSIAFTTLAPLVVCTLLPAAQPDPAVRPATAWAQAGEVVHSTRTATVAPRAAPRAVATDTPHRKAGVEPQPPTPSHIAGTAPALALLTPDSPDTTYVTSMAPSPHYDQDHTVVALGLGRTCACPVLLRSEDGGGSWQSTTVAAAGAQVLLPPDYPVDGRIFIGQEPGAVAPDWVSSGWGQPFAPLPLPPGQLAMAGDKLFSAANSGVWSFDKGLLAPVVSYQGVGTAAVASTGGVAYILAPAHSLGPGPTLASGPSLYACTPDCGLVGPVPESSASFLLAAAGSTIEVAGASGGVVLSADGGRSFQAVTPSSPATIADFVAATDARVWLVMRGQVQTRPVGQGDWAALSGPTDQALAAIVPLAGTRLIARLADGGIRCTSDAGTSWAARCAGAPSTP